MSAKKDNLGVQFARYLSIGLLLPAATLVGYAMGYGIDHVFGTRIFKFVFLLLGAAGGFMELVRELTRNE